ncbi:unnamed protein product, partial [marine sediment metagenome]
LPIGQPRADVERVMARYNVSREEAERWLSVYPALLKGVK